MIKKHKNHLNISQQYLLLFYLSIQAIAGQLRKYFKMKCCQLQMNKMRLA